MMRETDGQITIEEEIQDDHYNGKVREAMLNGTYFADSMQRIRDLEGALLWATGCKELMNTTGSENIITPLIKGNLWF